MNKYNPKHLLFILPILLIFGGFFAWQAYFRAEPGLSVAKPNIVIKGQAVAVEVADEAAEWFQGLSGRESLPDGQGMLFVFPDKQRRTFVMRRMNFPLDIIWIADDKVIQIDQNLPPEGEEPAERYRSELPVNYVLEVNAGLVERYGVEVGDEVSLNF